MGFLKRLFPTAAERDYNRGLKAFQNGDFVGAERAWLSSLGENPGCGKTLIALGNVEMARGNPEGALARYETAAAGGLEASALFGNMGAALRMLGRFGEARNAAERALELEPSDSSAKIQLGDTFLKLGQIDRAVEMLSGAAETDRQALEVLALSPELEEFRSSPAWRKLLDRVGKSPFAIMLIATSSGFGHPYPSGERHAIVAVALGYYLGDARRLLDDNLQAHGWCAPEIQTSGPIDDRSAATLEPHLRSAYDEALKTGFHLFVFSDPV